MLKFESLKRSDENLNNKKEYLDDLNNTKLSLRKIRNNSQIKRKRDYILFHINEIETSNVYKQFQFQIINFDVSFNVIQNYLNSDKLDLISYCLREISIYFEYNPPNIKEQKKIIETEFLNILLNLGNKFICENNFFDLLIILRILINITYFEEGNKEYFKDIYSNKFFTFYNKCLDCANKKNDEEILNKIYTKIVSIFNVMMYYDCTENFFLNLVFLRSPVFFQILLLFDKIETKEIEVIKSTIELINFTVNLQDSEEEIFDENDIKVINKCLDILTNELYSRNKEDLLVLIFEAISHISNLDDEYKFNSKILNEGITLKILKMKFENNKLTKNYLKIVKYSMRILANNLTLSDKNCQLLYDQNIIYYYNNILDKFDDYESIVEAILLGLVNISIGSKYTVLKESVIWEKKNMEKYLNFSDGIKIAFIKIIKYLLYKHNQDIFQFLYEKKILEYLMDIFVSYNIGKIVCYKILELIDYYLSIFNKQLKQTNEYLIIYGKFKDIFQYSEKILLLNEEHNNIPDIVKRIKNNYE